MCLLRWNPVKQGTRKKSYLLLEWYTLVPVKLERAFESLEDLLSRGLWFSVLGVEVVIGVGTWSQGLGGTCSCASVCMGVWVHMWAKIFVYQAPAKDGLWRPSYHVSLMMTTDPRWRQLPEHQLISVMTTLHGSSMSGVLMVFSRRHVSNRVFMSLQNALY